MLTAEDRSEVEGIAKENYGGGWTQVGESNWTWSNRVGVFSALRRGTLLALEVKVSSC